MTELSLNQILDRATGAGRKPKDIFVSYDRDLSEDEVMMLLEPAAIQPGTLKEIRQSHHGLARLIAVGTPAVDIAAITGFSVSRISVLKSDPTFAQLLAYYIAMEAEAYAGARADVHQRLQDLTIDTMETLHQKVLEKGDTMSVKELAQIVELGTDRIGYGKTSTVNNNVNHSVSPETLAAIRNAAPGAPELSEEDRRALLSIAREQASLPAPEGTDWIEGEGHLVREEGAEGDFEPARLAAE